MRALIITLAALLLVAPVAAQPAPPHRVSLPLLAASQTTLADLEAAAALGLLWPSETDAPLEVVRLDDADAVGACTRLGGEVRPVERPLGRLAAQSDPAWVAVRDAVLGLRAPLACHVGGVRGSLYLIGGVAEGGVAGLRALVVET